MKIPRTIPQSVRNELEDMERRRTGLNHADAWTAFVDWADRHGAEISVPPEPEEEVTAW
ncbi:hypothetical protein KX928_12645 [Roseobacter sp. YSTF-M11]|uniref:Uncharacterized protein n=1 Tax=Roseobacter insulae TaxID=2859783 RepID=A0A9X1FVX4_9RHOB|nr:hypothetical protein [Roseobacter insulae]MBW4708633.1 hypothetical protein [Roseobacter insulae]